MTGPRSTRPIFRLRAALPPSESGAAVRESSEPMHRKQPKQSRRPPPRNLSSAKAGPPLSPTFPSRRPDRPKPAGTARARMHPEPKLAWPNAVPSARPAHASTRMATQAVVGPQPLPACILKTAAHNMVHKYTHTSEKGTPAFCPERGCWRHAESRVGHALERASEAKEQTRLALRNPKKRWCEQLVERYHTHSFQPRQDSAGANGRACITRRADACLVAPLPRRRSPAAFSPSSVRVCPCPTRGWALLAVQLGTWRRHIEAHDSGQSHES